MTATRKRESVTKDGEQAYQEPERIASLSLVSTAARLVNTVVRDFDSELHFLDIDSVQGLHRELEEPYKSIVCCVK